MIGYKLFRVRRDRTLGSLFINRSQVIHPGVWYAAESHRTKGYAYRPGWHILARQDAPHLKKEGRVWAKVEFDGYETIVRPESQGGVWYLAKKMKIVEILHDSDSGDAA